MSSEKRNQLRASLFTPKKFRTVPFKLFEDELELRQPTVGAILDVKESITTKDALVRLLVQYCYVPGTDEKVFEDGDFDAIMTWPATSWLKDIQDSINKLTDLTVEVAEKN